MCEILVLQAGIEPMPCAVEVQSLNHWTSREGISSNSVFLAPPSPHPTATWLSQKQVARGASFALNPSSAIVGCVAFSQWQPSLSCLFNPSHLQRTDTKGASRGTVQS